MPNGELKFSLEKPILFQQKAVSILIQLEKPDYKQDTLRIYFNIIFLIFR